MYANLVVRGNCDEWNGPENACYMFVAIDLQFAGVLCFNRGNNREYYKNI